MKKESERLNKFKLAVFSQAQKQADDIVSDAQQDRKQRLADAKDKTHSDMLSELEQIDREYQADMVREISSRKIQAQRNVLTHRSEMIDRVFDNIRKQLLELCDSEKYPEELKARLDKCAAQAPDKKATAYFTKRDIELGRELCKGTAFTAEETSDFSLGGVLVVFKDSQIALDCTFDSALEQERENFSKSAGLGQI
ncbi:V-type ATP synthase subunit E family protein [Ruminococcus sp. FC2018]|jgi:V/A-type H+-transporting ATPase subunit E|uniref:V-type ATP synthase subunit E n=1 Tax=Ruminococcus sp. FC2018 TaxID=1410617 RepID=UPI00048D8D21|nr:V-type ATP synthase subunit E family protein [Ruminococcus sp. FC2018]